MSSGGSPYPPKNVRHRLLGQPDHFQLKARCGGRWRRGSRRAYWEGAAARNWGVDLTHIMVISWLIMVNPCKSCVKRDYIMVNTNITTEKNRSIELIDPSNLIGDINSCSDETFFVPSVILKHGQGHDLKDALR